MGGTEFALNSMTGGLYDALNDIAFDGAYEKRQEHLKRLAEQAGLGKAFKYTNYLIDHTAGNIPVAKALNYTAKPIFNGYRKLKKFI